MAPPNSSSSHLLLLLVLAVAPLRLLCGQTSAHCSFNQLCTCKYAPPPPPSQAKNGRGHFGHEEEVSTESSTFIGQFGTITTSHYDDLMPNSSRGGDERASGLKPAQNTNNIRDVSCIGVPFARIPDFPVPYITHIDVVDSGLESLESDVLSVAATIESARFMNNKIAYIEDDAFRAHFSRSLKSLDLSYNSLTEIPIVALSRLAALDWLNLHSNQISQLTQPAAAMAHNSRPSSSSLSTLFLGANDLTEIPPHFFAAFAPRLLWLNLDSNQLREAHAHAFPRSLVTLSLANNLLTKFPLELARELPALAWLNLRGNYIESLPQLSLQQHRLLDKLDLGENFITSVGGGHAFNGTLAVNDLNLDYNYLESLPAGALRYLAPRRLYLGMNRISAIDDKAFQGLEDTLELVDLERNKLNNVSWAFSHLRSIRFLYLANNNISQLHPDVFRKLCPSLLALSVAGNRLTGMPGDALGNCAKLAHLNLGYNDLTELEEGDLNWAASLDTLILRNNRLHSLGPRVFRRCPKLRELSLSFNAFHSIHEEAFADVGATLESLEISFGLRRPAAVTRLAFPEAAIRPLHKLLWLSLDNNHIEEVSETALYNQGELQYLNLESNRLTEIPHNLLHQNVHKYLLDVRLAYNRLTVIRSGTFSALPRLQTVVLTGNRLVRIESNSFRHLPNLVTLILTHNHISTVEAKSFVHLDNLQKLELQFNSLGEFSLAAFENCTKYPTHPMSLNLSHNALRHLTPMSSNRVPLIDTLDVSHNELKRVPKAFLEFLSASLRTLDLSSNQVSEIEKGSFRQLSLLQVLRLSRNSLIDLSKPAFSGLTGLQILDLSHNKLEMLQFGQFAGLTGLRSISLANNHLRSLPRDVFQSTALESADLSNNEFVAMPTSALTEASATIRYLNLSHNRIEHVDSTMFANTPHLLSLSLASNRLTILPDNIFIGLGGLMTLDLSRNPIRANLKELFHYVQRLRVLRLSRVDIEELPAALPLPSLTDLDVSANRLRDLSVAVMLPQLRRLNLSRNQFSHLPAHAWHSLPQLESLDLSYNPIRVLTKESFEGLNRLQVLNVQHLPDLTRFDADSLAQLSYLTGLYIQSWPSIEKFKFRLGSVVSGLASLKTLSAMILESNGVLYDQILGAFGPKLKELEITGPVKRLSLDAFEGIESYELLLTIRDTELTELPIGFADMFKNVVHFSLDLRNNKMERMAPEALYKNGSAWEKVGTRILQGGLALQGNPWRCSCENVWLGLWLRRWMRETLQLHTSGVERGQAIQSIVRTIECEDPEDEDRRRPLVDLDDDVHCYREMPVSGAAAASCCRRRWPVVTAATLVMLLLL